MEALKLALVVAGLDLAFQRGDHQLDVLDAVVQVGHGAGGGELLQDGFVARLFGLGVGADFAEEVVHGVGEELEAVVEVGELGGRGGVACWVGVLGVGEGVRGGLGSLLLLMLLFLLLGFLLLVLGWGRRRRGVAGGVGGHFEDFEGVGRFRGGGCYAEGVVGGERDLVTAEAGTVVDEYLKAGAGA